MEDKDLNELFFQVLIIAMVLDIAISKMALLISVTQGYLAKSIGIKILLIPISDIGILVGKLLLISVLSSLYFYKRQEDPSNLFVPLTT